MSIRTHASMLKLLAALSVVAAAGLTGCGGVQGAATGSKTGPVVSALRLSGSVHGGQQPVAGSLIQLYAAGSTGYGSAFPYTAGTSLLGTNVVTTDGNGGFNITGDYTCPSASTQVYLVASGGSPIPGQPANNNLSLMAALGPCGNLSASTYIQINELTTVASIWPLAPFMTGPANVGSSSSNTLGLANAFAVVNNVVNTSDGQVSGPTLPKGATLPVSEINTLADILATCVNSGGGVAGDGSPCGNLFDLTPNASGTAPTDVVTAALNIAQNPAQNAALLFALSPPTPPFQPSLSAPPKAWTIAINYKPAGTTLQPTGIAASPMGQIFVVDAANARVIRFSTAGAVTSGSGFAAGFVSTSGAIATDDQSSVYVVSKAGNSIITLNTSTGNPVGGMQLTGVNDPVSLAVDKDDYVWAVNASGSSVSVVTLGQSSATTLTGDGLSKGTTILLTNY